MREPGLARVGSPRAGRPTPPDRGAGDPEWRARQSPTHNGYVSETLGQDGDVLDDLPELLRQEIEQSFSIY
jgi:hypothetical protein